MCIGDEESGRGGTRDYSEPPPAPLIDHLELKKWSFYRAVIAEFIGTAIFLYVTIMAVTGYKKQSVSSPNSCFGVGLLGICWSFGGTIFLVVYCTAGVSGGHINPAVTLAFLLTRKVTLIRAVVYGVAQCLGVILGVGLVKALLSSELALYGGGVNKVSDGYSKGVALGAEIIGTFVLVYVVLSATDPKRNARDSHVPVLAPLPIGFAVFVVHLATIPITGTGINPARSLATAIVYRHASVWREQWIFSVGPFIGAGIGAIYQQFVLRGSAFKALVMFTGH